MLLCHIDCFVSALAAEEAKVAVLKGTSLQTGAMSVPVDLVKAS